jgi:hypothetical protein
VRDIALDPTSGDLLLEHGRARLTSPAKAENVRQRLQIRLGFWRGEYILDRSKGIPYQRALGRKDDGELLQAYVRGAASSCPGVDHLRSFTFSAARRAGSIALVAVAASGEPISLDDFRVSP